jgi:hypothetical protein
MKSQKTVKIFFVVASCVLLFKSIYATSYAGDFEELGASARALGLGGAYVASATDPSAIYYNPGASALIKTQQVLFLHSENFLGGIVQNNFLSYIRPQNGTAYGIGILTNRIPNIKITKLPNSNLPPSDSNQPIIDRIVTASDWVVYLNYARLLNNYLYVGGNFKFIYRSLGIGNAFGTGFDCGGMLLLTSDFKLGLKVTDLTSSPLFWSTKTRELISPKITIGIAKSFNFKTSNMILTSDLETNFDKFHLNNNFGVEYLYKNALALRFGFYHLNFTAGVGLTYKKIFIDYAYLSHYNQEDLGASQKFSGGIRF